MNNFFEIKNATFKAGGKEKIKNLSIEIKNEGDIVCLLGPSGIGKTTILRTCLLYTSPSPRDTA